MFESDILISLIDVALINIPGMLILLMSRPCVTFVASASSLPCIRSLDGQIQDDLNTQFA